MTGDRVIERERTLRDHVAGAADQSDIGFTPSLRGKALAVIRRDPALVAALQHGMGANQLALLEDADLISQGVDLDHAPAGGIGHAVEVAADTDHAVARDPPLQPQDGPEGGQRQRPQEGMLLGKGLHDNAARGGMNARVGHGGQPVLQLPVQVLEIAKGAGQEEVLADVAEGPLDLAFGLGPVRAAGFGMEAEVPGQVDQRAVVDNAAGTQLSPVTTVFMRS